MKRILLAGILALTCIGVLWAAGGKEAAGTITVLTHRTDIADSLFKADYVPRFNKEFPSIKVEFEAITEYDKTVRTRMNTKEYGDVLSMVTVPPVPADFGKFYAALGTSADLSKKYDFLSNFTFDGKVYGIAPNANANGFVYNKKVFKTAGITSMPKTPDEFLAAMKKIKAIGAAPVFLNYPSGWTLTQWEGNRLGVAADADYLTKIAHIDAPFSPGSPHYIINKLLYDVVKQGLIENDPLTSDWENSKLLMAQGKIGCMALGAWAIGQMMDVASKNGLDPNDIGYMPFPSSKNGKVYADVGPDYALAVNVNSKNVDAAKAWVFWMLDKSGYAEANKSIPSLKGGAYPAVLDAFKTLGVTFVVQNPAPAAEEGLTDKLDKQAEVGFWVADWRKRIVEAAMGTTKESFDDIMNDYNARWAKARKDLGVK